ncbi:MAG: hypothetical protein AAF716_18785 [Cyanobacteria bacterium P01_D01_bin.1]
MNNLLHVGRLITLERLQRLAVVLVAGLLVMIMTTACTPSSPTSGTATETTAGQMGVPEATPADVQRAQTNLSDEAVDEDVLSQQGASQARRSDATSIQ